MYAKSVSICKKVLVSWHEISTVTQNSGSVAGLVNVSELMSLKNKQGIGTNAVKNVAPSKMRMGLPKYWQM